ncbi:Serine/threonine-protein kinase MARK2 [Cytospora mali]|uniref:Serine/threonine-protein kinase MARK2 n=1 Tax=Cytospora mali TaxID=578113 RepID=A0A194W372_CYTMA|nr:Serine/threonine-protein kinase MARK2 [Valsa mali]
MAGLRIEPPSEVASEEKTEPYSQTEIDARMRSFQEQREINEAVAAANQAVHLDDLVVPKDKDIRILVRPLTRARSVSPGSLDNCEWLQLTAEVAEAEQPEQKVLAVTQTSRDIKFSVRIPGERLETDTRPPLWCELYYDPASDNQIFVNRSDIPLTLSRVSQHPATSPPLGYSINPHITRALIPGTWRIKVRGINVLDFRIVEKRPAILRSPSTMSSAATSLSDVPNSSGKRTIEVDDSTSSTPEKRLRAEDSAARSDDGVVMFMRPGNATNPLVFPLPSADKGQEIITSNGNPLLELEYGNLVEIPGAEVDADEYTIKKVGPIASTSLSAVDKAEFSREPDSIVTVKILKTRLNQKALASAKPHDEERNVIRQADIWLREFLNHEVLNHKSIPRLFGGDARYLSLYMEYVDAKDLTAKGEWQDSQTTLFTGTREDSERILRDVAGALDYIHSRKLVHNDIKPGNIMYNRERGAVLCDYGMSTETSANQERIGGTPFYICPEYIGKKLRGPPSDVWALGVTMLYVLGKIGLPDARGARNHPRQLYWMIAHVNIAPQHQRQQPQYDGRTAAQKMQIWLNEVNEAKGRLNHNDKLESLVARMLILNPKQRITMRQVMQELSRTPAEVEG